MTLDTVVEGEPIRKQGLFRNYFSSAPMYEDIIGFISRTQPVNAPPIFSKRFFSPETTYHLLGDNWREVPALRKPEFWTRQTYERIRTSDYSRLGGLAARSVA
jgi:hypothetical protein